MPNLHLEGLIGKRINGVIAKRTPDHSREMVFLVFDDGTFFEFYGPTVNNSKGCWRGDFEQAVGYLPDCHVLHTYRGEQE